jgi:Glycosyl transferase 4-like domain
MTHAGSMHVLAVAHDFDPMTSPQAIQIGRHLMHMKNVRISLVRASATGGADATGRGAAHISQLSVPEKPTDFPALHRLARLALPVFAKTPDGLKHWRKAVLAAVPQWLGGMDRKPDVLVTFGEPMSDHLIGLALKRSTRLPWVAHFSDPWADNPFRRGDPLTRWLTRRQEADVIMAADMVIFTSQETADLVGQSYADAIRRKFRVLGHGYDPSLFPNRAPLTGKLRISHIGSFYGNRTPMPLLEGLKILAERQPGLLDDLVIDLVGTMPGRMLRAAQGAGLPEHLVNTVGSVNYRESLARMVQSDLLVLIDAPARRSVFLASKLIDYIGSGRPIMAITPPGTAARVVSEMGGRTADPQSPESIADSLMALIPELHALRREKPLAVWGNDLARKAYSAATVAHELRQLLQEAMARP